MSVAVERRGGMVGRCLLVAAVLAVFTPIAGSADEGLRSDHFWIRMFAVNNGGTAHLQMLAPGLQGTGCLGELGSVYGSAHFQMLAGICPQMQWFLGGGPIIGVLFPELAVRTALGVPTPNPASSPVRFGFSLASGESGTIRIFDLSGRVVRTVIDGARGPLSIGLRWDFDNEQGQPVAPGVYFARLESGSTTVTRRIVFVGGWTR